MKTLHQAAYDVVHNTNLGDGVHNAKTIFSSHIEALAEALTQSVMDSHIGYLVDGVNFYYPDFPKSEWVKHKSVVPIYTAQPSIDALIADVLDLAADYNVLEDFQRITDKYRSVK